MRKATPLMVCASTQKPCGVALILVSTAEGWAYLAVVIDLFSRRVVGWSMQSHLRTELALEALEMAIEQRRPQPGLLFHSDRGVQYASHNFQLALAQHGMRPSMSRRGNCWDNRCS